MTGAVNRTRAEQTLIDQHATLADRLPGSAAVQAVRSAAISAFAAAGLPHRRVEEWKYTDLRSALTEAHAPAAISLPATAADLAVALGALGRLDVDRVVLIDGSWHAGLSTIRPSAGVTLGPLAACLAKADGPNAERLLGCRDTSDTVVALNSAFATDGVHVDVKPGATLTRPIMIVDVLASPTPARATTRHVIEIGAGAAVEVIEVLVALPNAATGQQLSTMVTVTAGADARVRHSRLSLAPDVIALARWRLALAAGVDYQAFQFTESPSLARNDIEVGYAGEGARLDLSGAFLARRTQHVDTTLVVDHAVPHCTSRELFKGVLADRARGVFQGKIIVRPDAQKTDGKMMAQALMLSPTTEFDSKPELEIYADDVVCGHGSTVAEIDPDLVFYCRARGIPEAEAKALLVASFIGEAIDRIANADLREAVMQRAEAWLARS